MKYDMDYILVDLMKINKKMKMQGYLNMIYP